MRIVLIIMLMLNLALAKKVALLIGNSSYITKPLDNPKNDVDLLEKKLIAIGFKVYKYKNLSKSNMIKRLREFYKEVDKETIALIYFSGHGIHSTIDNKNYLIPIGTFDSLFNEHQLSDLAISDNYLLSSMVGAKFSILLLDACRSNDFAKTRGGNKGLGQPQVDLDNDYIISYATDVGKTADDGKINSPYASALYSYLDSPYSLTDMFTLIRNKVSEDTRGKQRPLFLSKSNSIFYLNNEEKNINEQESSMIPLGINGYFPKIPDFPHGKGIVRKKGKCNSTDNGCLRGTSFPSFNNYLDSGQGEGVNDERKFLVLQNQTTQSEQSVMTNKIFVSVGDQIYARLYIHNNGNAQSLKTIANNVKIGILNFKSKGEGRYISKKSKTITLRAFIYSSNAIPTIVSDDAIIVSKSGKKIRLLFYDGVSALSSSKKYELLSKSFFNGGTNIGELSGNVSDSFYIQVTFKVINADKINAECSFNARMFFQGDLDYVSRDNKAFCKKGVITTNPQKILFPSERGHVTWECKGEDNSLVSCTATKL